MAKNYSLEAIEKVLISTPYSTLSIRFDYVMSRWDVILSSLLLSRQQIIQGLPFAALDDAIIELARQLSEIEIPLNRVYHEE